MRTWYWVDYVILLYQSASFLNELLFSMVRCEVYNNNMLPLKVKAAAPTLISISTFTSLLSLTMSRRKRCRPIWTSPLLFQIFEKFEKKGKSHKNTSARFYSTFEMNNKESELKRASWHLTFPCWVWRCEKTPLFQFELSVVYSLLLLLVKYEKIKF